ncbi:MAG: bifunctional UDP-N-acetylglucosamine diphosphorylase/glucosamine-1-phosphate N-acetyltransferase GlmU [Geminicoccaceae bacterium]|nr:bifunctional UDP-N-acetylglucosamine diphosphorylase/glucosamine-1-phosphate N-acetyltransferase GlmU [Geminicoccaceae bacterium]
MDDFPDHGAEGGADGDSDDAVAALVLAAGQGTRMRSPLAKVLHPLAGRSLIGHVLALAVELRCAEAVVVLAPGMDTVRAEVDRLRPGTGVALQERPLGTGDAVAAALDRLPVEGTVLVLFGDTPLLTAATVRRLLRARHDAGAAVAVLGMRPPNPAGYGRLRTAEAGDLVDIVEDRHADADLKRDAACNSGVMAIDAARLGELVRAIPLQPEKGEYYLTDIVRSAVRRGWRCVAVEAPWIEGHGVNSQAQLAEAEALWQARRRAALLEEGVTMVAPETVWLAVDCRIAPGVHIAPHVVFGPGVEIEAGAVIHSFCHIEGARVAAEAVVGPFARLRPGTRVGRKARLGNFVETKNAALDDGAKANHLTYLGDCTIGAGANIGAGTITCNYDGFAKYRTSIGEGAFVGSNTALVAPVAVGAGAIVGAGSVLTRDVPPQAVTVARAETKTREEAAAGLRARLQARSRARPETRSDSRREAGKG